MDLSPDQVIRVVLVMVDASPHVESVSVILDQGQGAFSITRVGSLDRLEARAFDLLVADMNSLGDKEVLKTLDLPLPIVLLVEPESEGVALTLLEKGNIEDYVLLDADHLRRLPTVLKKALARNREQEQPAKRNQAQVLQEAVYQIAEAAESAASLDDLLPEIHRVIGRVMYADNFYIALYDPIQETLSFPYFVDELDQLTETTVKAGNGLTEYVLRSGESLLCAQESQESLALKGVVDAVGPSSSIWLGVPLTVSGVSIGVMVVQHYHDRHAYGEPEQRMLEFVSSQVAMVIHRKRIYEALRSSEASFRGVFENASVGLARTTPDGQILLANMAMVRMLGFDSLEELKKRNLWQNGFAEGYSRRDFVERMERDGEVRGLEVGWLKADGSAIYVRESARAVHDEKGAIQYYESMVEDVTDRKRAEAAVQEKIQALQSLADIDREILAVEDAQSILNLVCLHISGLVKAPKSAIVAMESASRRFITATYGFKDSRSLDEEFSEAIRAGMLEHWHSFSVGDVAEDSKYMPHLVKRENIRALVMEPFHVSSNSVGSLVVFDTVSRQWTEDEVQLIRLLAGQAALVLEKNRLLTEARYRANEFSSLYQVAVEIMSRRDLGTVLNLIVNKATGFYRVSNAFIYLYDEARREVVLSVVSDSELMLGTTLKLGEGMAGRVAATLQPLIVEDYSEWDNRARVYEDRVVRAVLEVPMLYGGSLIGILGIESVDAARRFNEYDQLSLSLLAEQAASAIFNARLFSEIGDRNRELDRLARASSTLLAGVSSDIPTLCRSIANLLASEFHNSHCSIWLVKEDGLTLDRAGAAGPFVDLIKPALLTTKGPGIIAKAIRTKDSIFVSDVHAYEDYIEGWEKALSELVVPLRTGDRVLGAIDLQNQKLSAYSQDDIRLIELIASQAALMVEHVRLYLQTDERLHQLTVLSNIDAAIASSLDLQVTLNILVSQISMHLETDAVDVMLLNPHLQMLEYAAGRGFRGSAIRRVSLLLGEDQAGVAALERSVISEYDLFSPQVPLRHPERIVGEDFVSMYAVPLVAKGQVKGVLELFYRRLVEPNSGWIHFLEILARQAAVAVEDASLFNDMQRSFTELAVAYDAAIEGWARVLQMRHHEPDELAQTLASLTLDMAHRMELPESEMSHIYRGVLLHDIGKLDISDNILLKSAPLTDEEWDEIHRHPVFAYDFLQSIAYLRPAMNIPYCHHERWDGNGYPRGLHGKEIPLEARIFSVVKVWTVLQHARPFRPAFGREYANAYVKEQSGKEFDPQVVEIFLEMLNEQSYR
ncbi:MAG: GAF domain-containing protein [Chloroflexi bacterium]|nr:GAF domain-containing protein [Chloroflexota bacterium]